MAINFYSLVRVSPRSMFKEAPPVCSGGSLRNHFPGFHFFRPFFPSLFSSRQRVSVVNDLFVVNSARSKRESRPPDVPSVYARGCGTDAHANANNARRTVCACFLSYSQFYKKRYLPLLKCPTERQIFTRDTFSPVFLAINISKIILSQFFARKFVLLIFFSRVATLSLSIVIEIIIIIASNYCITCKVRSITRNNYINTSA